MMMMMVLTKLMNKFKGPNLPSRRSSTCPFITWTLCLLFVLVAQVDQSEQSHRWPVHEKCNNTNTNSSLDSLLSTKGLINNAFDNYYCLQPTTSEICIVCRAMKSIHSSSLDMLFCHISNKSTNHHHHHPNLTSSNSTTTTAQVATSNYSTSFYTLELTLDLTYVC